MADSRINQRTLLLDGRRMGFAEFGDPMGRPVFVLPDLPGSRFFGRHLELAALKWRVRILCVDYPGIGLSDSCPGYRLLDWVDNLQSLAESLSLPRFAVIGISGGAPFALACATKIPERMTRAVVLNGLGPYSIAETNPWWDAQAEADFRLAREDPAQFRRNWAELFRLGLEDLLDAIIAQLPPVDRQALANPVVVEVIRDDLREAFHQGAGGAVEQAAAIWGEWGFNLREIHLPVSVFHGGEDRNVPPDAGAYIASMIPGSHARFYPEDGHLSLFINHPDDIMRELITASGSLRL
ncbi:MAG TPA: alpha/beta hydrolase [Anaerolineaceae bacterium]|nr:alpha/beta hydrolase [Anaerolineaceae bacterium]